MEKKDSRYIYITDKDIKFSLEEGYTKDDIEQFLLWGAGLIHNALANLDENYKDKELPTINVGVDGGESK